jgi:hypothetical protein
MYLLQNVVIATWFDQIPADASTAPSRPARSTYSPLTPSSNFDRLFKTQLAEKVTGHLLICDRKRTKFRKRLVLFGTFNDSNACNVVSTNSS